MDESPTVVGSARVEAVSPFLFLNDDDLNENFCFFENCVFAACNFVESDLIASAYVCRSYAGNVVDMSLTAFDSRAIRAVQWSVASFLSPPVTLCSPNRSICS